MKKLFVLLFAVLVLAACSQDVYEGVTAEEAIINLQKDFVTELTDLQVLQINDKETIGVFKAVISGEPEVFVTLTVKENDMWRVQEAVAVGHENKDDLPPAKGQYIVGEIIDKQKESTEPYSEGELYYFNLPGGERTVTISLR